MFTWLSANWGSIVVIAVLALVVGLIIYGMIREKKRGKSSCGGGCSGCAYSGSCPSAARGQTNDQ